MEVTICVQHIHRNTTKIDLRKDIHQPITSVKWTVKFMNEVETKEIDCSLQILTLREEDGTVYIMTKRGKINNAQTTLKLTSNENTIFNYNFINLNLPFMTTFRPPRSQTEGGF